MRAAVGERPGRLPLEVEEVHVGRGDERLAEVEVAGIEDLVLELVPGDAGGLRAAVEEKYPTASVAELRFAPSWTELARGGATLARFVRPRDLDPSLGPDAD